MKILFLDQSDNEGDNGGDNDNPNSSQNDQGPDVASSPDRNKAGGWDLLKDYEID